MQVNAGKHFHHELPAENNSFLYVFEGDGQLNGQSVPLNTLIALGSDDHSPEFVAGEQGARFIMISGKPINESIVQYGPFVMNTEDQIRQCIRNYQQGLMGNPDVVNGL